MAPIVINLKTRIGRQVPLETTRYTVAMEIPVPAAVAEAQARKAATGEPVSE
jgi:flagellar assembly factor FliW